MPRSTGDAGAILKRQRFDAGQSVLSGVLDGFVENYLSAGKIPPENGDLRVTDARAQHADHVARLLGDAAGHAVRRRRLVDFAGLSQAVAQPEVRRDDRVGILQWLAEGDDGVIHVNGQLPFRVEIESARVRHQARRDGAEVRRDGGPHRVDDAAEHAPHRAADGDGVDRVDNRRVPPRVGRDHTGALFEPPVDQAKHDETRGNLFPGVVLFVQARQLVEEREVPERSKRIHVPFPVQIEMEARPTSHISAGHVVRSIVHLCHGHHQNVTFST